MVQKARVHVADQEGKGDNQLFPATLLTEVIDRCLDWLRPEPEDRGDGGPVTGAEVSTQKRVGHLLQIGVADKSE